MKVIAGGRELLERLADRHGLDGLMEIYALQEGEFPETPEQRAFALLGFGLSIYTDMAHAKYFPAKSARSRRRGARGIRQSLALPTGERAVVFLSHAVPAYAVAFWQCHARYEDSEVNDSSWYEDYHGAIRAGLGDFYPLNAEDEQALADARREVDVFETQIPTEIGELPSRTGYNQALRDGENPDGDPELVESHGRTALHTFRLWSQNHALRVGLENDDYQAVKADLLNAWDLGAATLAWWAALNSYWSDVLGDYFELVRPRPELDT